MHLLTSFARRLCAVCVVLGLCWAVSACSGRGSIQAGVHNSPGVNLQTLSPADSLWLKVENSTESEGVSENFHSVLVAFLQSDAGVRLADSEATAAYILYVKILQVGLSASVPLEMDFAEGLGSAASGAVVGLGIGSAISPKGAGWGAGAGLLVGLGIGYASTASDNQDTWTMLADVALDSAKNVKKTSNREPAALSQIEVYVQGTNLTREQALPALEDALAQEIAKHFRKEPS